MTFTPALLALIATATVALGSTGPQDRSEPPWPPLATALQEGLTPEQTAVLWAGNVHTGIPRAEATSDCGTH